MHETSEVKSSSLKKTLRILFGVAVLLCAITITIVGISRFILDIRGMCVTANCSSGLEQVGLALSMYAADYDNHLPPMEDSQAWPKALFNYTKYYGCFCCPGVRDGRNAPADGTADYAMNAYLGGADQTKLQDSFGTITICDYATAYNPWITCLPPASSLAQRHRGGANYLFADGHVKWMIPLDVSCARTRNALGYFAPR